MKAKSMYITRKYSFAHGLLGLRFFVKSINGKPPLVFCWHLTSYCDVTDRSSSTNPPNPWAILFVWLWLHSFTRESRFMSYLQIYGYSFLRNDLSLVNCINALVKFWIKRKRLMILWFLFRMSLLVFVRSAGLIGNYSLSFESSPV